MVFSLWGFCVGHDEGAKTQDQSQGQGESQSGKGLKNFNLVDASYGLTGLEGRHAEIACVVFAKFDRQT